MIKKLMLTLGALALVGAANAQKGAPCATDLFHQEQVALHPEIKEIAARMDAEMERDLHGKKAIGSSQAKATNDATDEATPWPNDVTQYHIPVVVHIIYDFNGAQSVYITDNDVYGMISRLNLYYNKQDPALSSIITPFQPYIGNAHTTFHLATKDPQGKPTRGITRTYSYLSAGGDEAAKIDQWPPNQYLNLYFINYIGRGTKDGTVLAYATFPEDYTTNPYSQGVISRADAITATGGNGYTVGHEIGHFFRLYHTWNSNGKGSEESPLTCGDDEVDDTPPTTGHFYTGCSKLYDTMCATGYIKYYDGATAYHMFADSSASSKAKNYPDTTNTQNIMDYSSCNAENFTRGQAARMRAAMRSTTGYRSSLKDSANLIATGIWDASYNFIGAPDIAPTALFTVNRPFVCADNSTAVTLTNRSYNDTIAAASWVVGKTANGTSSSIPSFAPTFSDTGWVPVTLTVTGNGANPGTGTLTRNDLVYAADPTPTPAYIEDFNPTPMLGKFPIFNYFGTDHKWEVTKSAGLYDYTSMKYNNFDPRTSPTINTASLTPGGVYADFYTPGYDLTGFGANCFVDFWSAGAYRTNKPSQMNDTLFVYYSSNCGASWSLLTALNNSSRPPSVLARGDLGNNGYRNDNFIPTYPGEWAEHSFLIPENTPIVNYRTNHTFFRIRFKSGTDISVASGFSLGTGNNFYLDRFAVTANQLNVKNGVIVKLGMSVAPNPTSGAATVTINGGDNSLAEVNVTDVTGKMIYHTSATRSSLQTKIEIPAAALAVKGMYLVHVVTNGATETRKLVVY